VSDTIASQKTQYSIIETIKNARKDVVRLINQARSGNLKRQPGSTLIQTFEVKRRQ